MPDRNEAADTRHILRSTSLIGAATAGTILFSLLRIKFVALWLGPPGVGLFGILSTLMTACAAILGVGLGSSAVQRIASHVEDPWAVNRIRIAVWLMTTTAALIGMVAIFLLRDPLARLSSDGLISAQAVAWTGIAVALTIWSATQLAEIQGFRHTEHFARVRLYGAALAAIAGVAAVFAFGFRGVLAAVVLVPAANLIVAERYRRKLPRINWKGDWQSYLSLEWRALTALGLAVTLGAMIGSIYQMGGRIIIVRELGIDAAGLFQAAWTLAGTTTGLILAAMAADYYPRLAQASKDSAQVSYIFNQQVQVTLLLGGPMLTVAAGAAPIAMQLFYSEAFLGGTRLFQWAVAAEFLKIVGWSAGFVFLARGHSALYVAAEALFALGFIAGGWFLLRRVGLEGIGVAYLLSYGASVAICLGYMHLRHGVSLRLSNVLALAGHTLLMLAIMAVSFASARVGLVVACLIAALLAVRSIRRLDALGIRFLPRILRASDEG